MSITRDQQRAQKAYEKITSVTTEKDDYGTQCKGLPALIHECGLAQAVAFLQAKGKDRVLNDLASVMEVEDLAQSSRTADLAEYTRLSREALACAQWMKRYAEAFGLGTKEE